MEPLFAVEVLLEHGKTKDHLNFSVGDVARVLLLSHPKLPSDRYLVEKEDGTSKFGVRVHGVKPVSQYLRCYTRILTLNLRTYVHTCTCSSDLKQLHDQCYASSR